MRTNLDKSELDVEIKMAGKAREKFKQIDAEGSHPVAPSHENKVFHFYFHLFTSLSFGSHSSDHNFCYIQFNQLFAKNWRNLEK